MEMSKILIEIDRINSKKEEELELDSKQEEKKYTKEDRIDLLEDIAGLKKSKTKGLEKY